MFSLAKMEYVQFLRRNLFIAVQISVVLFVTMLLSSTIWDDWQMYAPLSGFEGKHGLMFTANQVDGTNKEEVKNELEQVDEVLTWGDTGLVEQKTESVVNTIVYPRQIIENFCPKIKSGRWLRTVPDKLEIVVTENPYGWKKGDTIPFYYYTDEGKKKEVMLSICGVLQEGAAIWGSHYGEYPEPRLDYRDFYSTYRYHAKRICRIFILEDLAKKMDLPVQYDNEYLVSFQDNISKSQENDNIRHVNDGDIQIGEGRQDIVLLDKFIQKSQSFMIKNMQQYIPLLISVLFIAVISVINIAILNAYDSIKKNAIYSILGLQWKKVLRIPFMESLIMTSISIMLLQTFMILVKIWGLRYLFPVSWNTLSIPAVGAILVFMIVLHVVVPALLLRRKQPVEILKQMED